jgi:hypothetical protein
MGLLSFLSKSKGDRLMRLPSGSFTLDREGKVMTSTLPQSFPAAQMREIGQRVLASFQAAKKAQMPLSEIIIYYAALKLLARELRGGAIVFLMPQSLNHNLKKTNN